MNREKKEEEVYSVLFIFIFIQQPLQQQLLTSALV